MKNFKTYSAIAAGLMIMIVLLLAPISGSKGQSSGIERLIAVTQLKAQTASDEASRSAEKQRSLVKQFEMLRSPARESTKRTAGPVTSKSGGLAADDNQERQQPGRLTSREIAREKAVLQQLEANARRSAEVLESVKRLAAELERQPRR
jgi:hypothetical protein